MSDVIIVSWPVDGIDNYGLLTDKSYPHVYGVGSNLGAAKAAKQLGADFVDESLEINYNRILSVTIKR